ncbi:GNAT family N-acetyltransferase [Hydrogenophaga sp. 5NK40-0174]|uniref:GNAT family N-acetyltransferase n=1 Tax=Hydrogenophaga sp. 5NK40-0174 TaxID=3127649 RepID=UPI00310C0DA0
MTASSGLQWSCLSFGELSPQALYALLALRSAVFVVEQNCVYQDVDGKDPQALHVMGWHASDTGSPTLLASTRLLPPGASFAEASIGRVVTAPVTRGTGLGHELMAKSIDCLFRQWGVQDIRIGAQSHLQGFYARHGFVRDSDEYDEDGIPHVEMVRRGDSR